MARICGPAPAAPIFLSYVLSFVYVGIYWNNHHHMFHTVQTRRRPRAVGEPATCSSGCRWCRSRPAWMGENHFAPIPVAVYGVELLCARRLHHPRRDAAPAPRRKTPTFAKALGSDLKGNLSLRVRRGVPLAFVNQWTGVTLYVLVTTIWFVPDKRFERLLEK